MYAIKNTNEAQAISFAQLQWEMVYLFVKKKLFVSIHVISAAATQQRRRVSGQ